MFLEEMKKIWKPGTVVIMAVLSVLFFYSFMDQWIRPFRREHDSFAEKMGILTAWIGQYGNDIDEDEFQEIENAYQHTLDHARLVIQENDCFGENGVHSYENYLAYEQKALNGRDGYDYTVYSEMRRLISEDIKQSPMYLQEYGDAVRHYRISGGARNSILPYEVLAYAGSYLVNLMILCLLCVFFVASPVMVDDRESNVADAQYSSKVGKKIYRVQYICMMVSSFLVVSAAVVAGMLAWSTTGTDVFAESDVSSFLNTEHFVVSITFKEYIVFFIIMTYLLAMGTGSILFFLSAHSPNMTAMLLKSSPAVVGSILTALLLQNAFSGQNVFYRLSGVRYCEMIVAAVVWTVGFLLNIYSPESDCRCGVRRGIISKRKRYLYRRGENIGKK